MIIPIECRLITIGVSGLVRYNSADTLQHVHNDQMRFVEIGCDFGITTFTVMVEGDHDLSHDLTRRL